MHQLSELKLRESNNAQAYFNPDNVCSFRHEIMRDFILPVIKHFGKKKFKWVTIGDGNFASDAYYLQSQGINVLATSISDETISEAKFLGYINKFKVINAEDIDAKSGSFDFAFCKEAFHHFPRPFVALYEMLRISRKGVILIEPQETGSYRLFDWLKKCIKLMLKKDFDYEPAGNYIYRINIREIEKAMLSMNYRVLAYKRFNDFYISSLADKRVPGIGKILTLIGISIQNLLCRLRFMNYGLAAVVLFKDNIGDDLEISLKKSGYTVKKLSVNPYL